MTTSPSSPLRQFWFRFASSVAAVALAGSLASCSTTADSSSTTATATSTASATADASSTASTSTETATSSASSSATATDAAASTTDDASTTAETITDTTVAAEAFFATLTAEQQEQVLYSFDDETKTTSWSNFPVTFVERAGLNLTDLTEEQQTAALAVLESLLSEEGYATAVGIMDGDQYLVDNSSTTEALGQYYIAFFGEPSDTEAWELQFGGHHLGINATLDGTADAITFAPTHLGSQPAVYTAADGTEVQPLAGMYETAFAFYDSLTAEQQAALYQGEEVSDLTCAPGGTCDFPTGTGIAGSDLTDEQKQLLLDVIANWVGLADEETTTDALAEIEATLDDTYVNWSGATVYDMTQGSGIYFQISGPNVFIELSDQQGSAGADVDGVITAGWGHIHTIYRDPTNDYANSVTQQSGGGMMGGSRGGTPPNG